MFDVACHFKGVVVSITGHTYHEIYTRRTEKLCSFLGGTNLCERGRVTQSQLSIFVKDFLVNASVVLKHECIIGISHDEYIKNAVRHKVYKRHVTQYELVPLLGDIVILHR